MRGGWKLNASIRTIEWRLSRDLSLSDFLGYFLLQLVRQSVLLVVSVLRL